MSANPVSRDDDFPHPKLSNLRPRDAATLIIIDRAKATPAVLMGRRHGASKFMPGKFVFPGGRLDAVDRRMASVGALDAAVEQRLAAHCVRPSATRGRALALAAIRETFEETGLLLGARDNGAPRTPPGVWEHFRTHGVTPALEPMHFIARAITPPKRPRRFDARFFAVDAQAVAHKVDGVVGPDAELTELVWIPLPEAKTLDLPMITRVVLGDLDKRIAAGFDHALPSPFYFERNRKWVRLELGAGQS